MNIAVYTVFDIWLEHPYCSSAARGQRAVEENACQAGDARGAQCSRHYALVCHWLAQLKDFLCTSVISCDAKADNAA